MLRDGKYHKLLGLPQGSAALWAGVLDLRYGNHAQSEADVDRYGRAELFSSAEFQASDVVEVEVVQGQPVKAVLRFPYSDDLDLVMVLQRPERGVSFVRTVWFNRANDQHKSLDRSKYRKP